MKKVNDLLFKFFLEPAVKITGILLLLVIMLQIFGRAFMSTPPSWTEEMSRFFFLWYSFFACAVTLRAKQHLGLDYFYRQFNPRFREVLDYIIQVLVLAFGAYTAFYGVQLLSIVAKRKAPISGWSMTWFYLILPIMGVLFVLISLENLQELWAKKKAKEGPAK
ncbi:MAG: TRAP transporter small permease [Oscillibacter sp.]|nr:TRAP transporter small permease [Oscillibacter sp.]